MLAALPESPVYSGQAQTIDYIVREAEWDLFRNP